MSKVTKIMLVSFITNISLSIIKIITGLLGKSSAIIVDGIHSFSDLTTDVIAILGNIVSKKPADLKHPYGHGKSEYVTSFIIGIIIILLGLGTIKNLGESNIVSPNILVSFIVALTILAKTLLARYLTKKGTESGNSIIIASGKESGADVITSIIVLISTLLSQLSDTYTIFKYTDKVAGIIVAIFIVKIGMDIVKDNISYILGECEIDELYTNDIKDIILSSNDVSFVNDLVILKYGPYFKLLAEVAMNGDITLTKAHDEIDIIESKIKNYDYKISYITIHMCPE